MLDNVDLKKQNKSSDNNDHNFSCFIQASSPGDLLHSHVFYSSGILIWKRKIKSMTKRESVYVGVVVLCYIHDFIDMVE